MASSFHYRAQQNDVIWARVRMARIPNSQNLACSVSLPKVASAGKAEAPAAEALDRMAEYALQGGIWGVVMNDARRTSRLLESSAGRHAALLRLDTGNTSERVRLRTSLRYTPGQRKMHRLRASQTSAAKHLELVLGLLLAGFVGRASSFCGTCRGDCPPSSMFEACADNYFCDNNEGTWGSCIFCGQNPVCLMYGESRTIESCQSTCPQGSFTGWTCTSVEDCDYQNCGTSQNGFSCQRPPWDTGGNSICGSPMAGIICPEPPSCAAGTIGPNGKGPCSACAAGKFSDAAGVYSCLSR